MALFVALGSVYANAVSHRHGFRDSNPRQDRCGLEVFTWNRFRQKIQGVMVEASATLPAKLNNAKFAPKL